MAHGVTEGQGADRPQVFESYVSEVAGGVLIRLGGELDTVTVPQYLTTVTDAIDRGRSGITIDLGELTFIDSTGLGALVGSLKQARDAGGDLRLRNPHPSTRKVLQIAGLTRVFEIEDNITASPSLEGE